MTDKESQTESFSESNKQSDETATSFRNFSLLHNHIWRIVWQYPILFIVLPVAVWYPFDLLAEYVALKQSGGFLSELKAYYRITPLTSFFVGSWVSAVLLVAIYKMAHDKIFSLREVLAESTEQYGKVLGVVFAFSWRVGLGLILLIIPGIVVALRYALALPAAIFEDEHGKYALEISERHMRGKSCKLMLYLLGGTFLYLPGLFGLIFLLPEQETPLLNAVSSIPVTIIGSLFTVALGLLYVDVTGNRQFKWPISAGVDKTTYNRHLETSSGFGSVIFALVISFVIFIAGLYWVAVSPAFPGEKMVFGDRKHEIYYQQDIESSDIKKLGDALTEYGYFDSENSQAVRLTRDDTGYKLYIFVMKEWWKDEDIIESLRYLQSHLSEDILDEPVSIFMIDDTWEGREEKEVGPS